jgi:hypothetical protein
MAGMERYAMYSDNCQSLLHRRIQSECRSGEILPSVEGGSQERLPSKAIEDDGESNSRERCNSSL